MNDGLKKTKRKNFFMVDNAFIDRYDFLSTTTKMVYIVLCRYRNSETGICQYSEDFLSSKASVTRETFSRHLKILRKYNIIKTTKSYAGYGKFRKNIYHFTNPSFWQKPCDIKSHGQSTLPCDFSDKKPVILSHTINTIKNTKEIDILRKELSDSKRINDKINL